MPVIEVRKRKNEPVSSLLYRFSKRVKQSGVIKEIRRRQFRGRKPNKRKIRLSAKYRKEKTLEIDQQRKYGYQKMN